MYTNSPQVPSELNPSAQQSQKAATLIEHPASNCQEKYLSPQKETIPQQQPNQLPKLTGTPPWELRENHFPTPASPVNISTPQIPSKLNPSAQQSPKAATLLENPDYNCQEKYLSPQKETIPQQQPNQLPKLIGIPPWEHRENHFQAPASPVYTNSPQVPSELNPSAQQSQNAATLIEHPASNRQEEYSSPQKETIPQQQPNQLPKLIGIPPWEVRESHLPMPASPVYASTPQVPETTNKTESPVHNAVPLADNYYSSQPNWPSPMPSGDLSECKCYLIGCTLCEIHGRCISPESTYKREVNRLNEPAVKPSLMGIPERDETYPQTRLGKLPYDNKAPNITSNTPLHYPEQGTPLRQEPEPCRCYQIGCKLCEGHVKTRLQNHILQKKRYPTSSHAKQPTASPLSCKCKKTGCDSCLIHRIVCICGRSTCVYCTKIPVLRENPHFYPEIRRQIEEDLRNNKTDKLKLLSEEAVAESVAQRKSPISKSLSLGSRSIKSQNSMISLISSAYSRTRTDSESGSSMCSYSSSGYTSESGNSTLVGTSEISSLKSPGAKSSRKISCPSDVRSSKAKTPTDTSKNETRSQMLVSPKKSSPLDRKSEHNHPAYLNCNPSTCGYLNKSNVPNETFNSKYDASHKLEQMIQSPKRLPADALPYAAPSNLTSSMTKVNVTNVTTTQYNINPRESNCVRSGIMQELPREPASNDDIPFTLLQSTPPSYGKSSLNYYSKPKIYSNQRVTNEARVKKQTLSSWSNPHTPTIQVNVPKSMTKRPSAVANTSLPNNKKPTPKEVRAQSPSIKSNPSFKIDPRLSAVHTNDKKPTPKEVRAQSPSITSNPSFKIDPRLSAVHEKKQQSLAASISLPRESNQHPKEVRATSPPSITEPTFKIDPSLPIPQPIFQPIPISTQSTKSKDSTSKLAGKLLSKHEPSSPVLRMPKQPNQDLIVVQHQAPSSDESKTYTLSTVTGHKLGTKEQSSVLKHTKISKLKVRTTSDDSGRASHCTCTETDSECTCTTASEQSGQVYELMKRRVRKERRVKGHGSVSSSIRHKSQKTTRPVSWVTDPDYGQPQRLSTFVGNYENYHHYDYASTAQTDTDYPTAFFNRKQNSGTTDHRSRRYQPGKIKSTPSSLLLNLFLLLLVIIHLLDFNPFNLQCHRPPN